MVAKRAQEQLERLGFDNRLSGRIVDHQMGKIRLPGDRTERSELRRGKARQIQLAGARIGDIVEHRFLRTGRKRAVLPEKAGVQIWGIILAHMRHLMHRAADVITCRDGQPPTPKDVCQKRICHARASP